MNQSEFSFLFFLYLNICMCFFKKKYLLIFSYLKFYQNKNMLYNKTKYLILFKILFKIKNLRWHFKRYLGFYTNLYSKICDVCPNLFFFKKKIYLSAEFKYTKQWILCFSSFFKKNFQNYCHDTCVQDNVLIYEKKHIIKKKKKGKIKFFPKKKVI
mmetsp:Transcript_88800/g.236399  ORF Transcript_88800/g.236399 Transcript_88800/m.236399 type:complete len:156 (+) Transcript_88800:6462-6929(+)